MSSTLSLKDNGGFPISRGDAVVGWQNGEPFTATVAAITASAQLMLTCEDGTTVERESDAVEVVVPDNVALYEADLTATVDHRQGDDRFVIRLSGRAGLNPVEAGQPIADPHTRALSAALLAVPGVSGCAVVATTNNRKRNIVIYCAADASAAAVAQAAWRAARDIIDNVRLTGAFWQPEATKD